ncbi:MAG: sulfatase [Acidobacteriota bacterium]
MCRRIGLPALCLAALYLDNCKTRPDTVERDLLLHEPAATSPTTMLRPGDESVRQLLVEGFDLSDRNELTIPPNRSQAVFAFEVSRPAALDIVFHGYASPACEAVLRVNDRFAGNVFIGSSKSNYFLRVPQQLVESGRNIAELKFPCHRDEGGGPRAVLDFIKVGKAENAIRRVNKPSAMIEHLDDSEVSWLVLPEEDTLEFRCSIESPEKAECSAALYVELDGVPKHAVWQESARTIGRREFQGRIDLSSLAGRPSRISAQFGSDHPGARLSWNRLALVRRAAQHREHPETPKRSTPNILIFLVDTLRRDHLSLYGYPYPTSPELEKFGSEAVVFDNAWTQCSWTSPAVASLFTGEYPSAHGIRTHNDRLHPNFGTLAEFLQQHGYRTAACVANTGIGVRGGYEQGFDDFRFMPRAGVAELVETALEQAEQAPFFIYVHVMEPHYPYLLAPAPFNTLARKPKGVSVNMKLMNMYNLRRRIYVPNEVELDYMRSLYDSEIALMDHHFGRLIRGLKERGRYDDTVVVFIADHGEEFRDHNGYYHGHSLYNELTRLSLVVKPAAPFESHHVKQPVQTIDIFPTLAALVDHVPAHMQGRSLLDVLGSPARALDRLYPIFSETELHAEIHSVVMGRYKLIMFDRTARGTADDCRLYDLARDPAERKNLVSEQPVRAAYMASLLRQHQREAERRLKVSREELHRTLDRETVEELRALGYLGAEQD